MLGARVALPMLPRVRLDRKPFDSGTCRPALFSQLEDLEVLYNRYDWFRVHMPGRILMALYCNVVC